MAELDMVLGRLERINGDIYSAVRRNDKQRNKDLLALRGEFSGETGNLIREIASDPRLAGRPELADEFSNRLFDIRQALAAHQAKWRSVNIDESHDDYVAATGTINNAINDYIRWAKGQLAA